jgi:hypothetical protein
VLGIYRPAKNGRLLVEWLKDDWAMFSHPAMDLAHCKELLGDILNDGEIVRATFAPSELSQTDRLVRWEKLRQELMYENRFFPQAQIDVERLEVLLSLLILDADEIPVTWYRARIQDGDAAYQIEQMGAPPKEVAPHGRANPAGIPYLYLGSLDTTAIAEVRPYPGEVVCVADFTIANDLKIVDLRNPRKQVSPFLLSDEHEIALLRGDIGFLEQLGNELTRPILPRGAAIGYIPSQYLGEFVKKCGYNGVIYRSSVSDGMNLALFHPSRATIGSVKRYSIIRVSVDVKDFPSKD